MSTTGAVSSVFQRLTAEAPHRVSLRYLDMRLKVQSHDEEALRILIRSLDCWKEGGAGSGARVDISCTIDYTENWPGWREVLLREPSRAPVEVPGSGPAFVSEQEDWHTIWLQGRGVFVAGLAGQILYLIDDQEGNRAAGGDWSLNTAAISHLLTAHCLRHAGYLLVHAGAVARNNHCHLVTGPSGIGKSTWVLNLVSKGWDFYGDDIVVLGKDREGRWNVHPVRSKVRATTETCARFPQLSNVDPLFRSDRKRCFAIEDYFEVRIPPKGRVDAIYCLRKDSDRLVRKLSAEEAFEQLAPGFFSCLWTRDAPFVMDSLFDIVSTTPVFSLSRNQYPEIGGDR